jgi:hypothetical protein
VELKLLFPQAINTTGPMPRVYHMNIFGPLCCDGIVYLQKIKWLSNEVSISTMRALQKIYDQFNTCFTIAL